MTPGGAEDDGDGIVGRVVFHDSGRIREAVFHEDGRWTCADAPGVAEILNGECAPLGDLREGLPGRDMLIKAARMLSGMAWLGSGRSASTGGPPGRHGG